MVPNPVDMAKVDLRRVERAAASVQASRAELVAAILAAAASGETYRDIAEVAGLSHQRVGQIVKEAQK